MQTQDNDGAIGIGLLQFVETLQSTFEQFIDCRCFFDVSRIHKMTARKRNGVIQVLYFRFVGAEIVSHDALENAGFLQLNHIVMDMEFGSNRFIADDC